MHKGEWIMKLEIKLKDPKYCDGCSCLGGFLTAGCGHYDKWLGRLKYRYGKYKNKTVIRPQKCIKENGL